MTVDDCHLARGPARLVPSEQELADPGQQLTVNRQNRPVRDAGISLRATMVQPLQRFLAGAPGFTRIPKPADGYRVSIPIEERTLLVVPTDENPGSPHLPCALD
jgi:hypothetical protein